MGTSFWFAAAGNSSSAIHTNPPRMLIRPTGVWFLVIFEEKSFLPILGKRHALPARGRKGGAEAVGRGNQEMIEA